jgi:hypothetical protein
MLALFGLGCFFVVGLVVGVRLLALWHRTRKLPELLAALALLGTGPLGVCILGTGFLLFGDTSLMPLFRATGLAIQGVGFSASACFAWRVFRPNDSWAVALTAIIGLGLLADGFGMFILPAPAGEFGLRNHVSIILKILAFGWGAFESLHYWRISSRRVAIGFADPLVSASFLMWGIALAAGTLGLVGVYAAIALLGPGAHQSPPGQLFVSCCGVVAAAALYLSFLPPQAYRRRIEARSPAAGG